MRLDNSAFGKVLSMLTSNTLQEGQMLQYSSWIPKQLNIVPTQLDDDDQYEFSAPRHEKTISS